MPVHTRTTTPADKEACLELLSALTDATGGAMSSDAGTVFDALQDGARGTIIVAEEGDTLLGLASLSFNLAMRYGGEYCQLEELIVDPAARGKNVGALLVEASVEVARTRGCAEYGLYLVETTAKNRPFYEKFGFNAVGTEMRQPLT